MTTAPPPKKLYDPFIIGSRGERWLVAHRDDVATNPDCPPITTHGAKCAAQRMADRLNAAYRQGFNAGNEYATT